MHAFRLNKFFYAPLETGGIPFPVSEEKDLFAEIIIPLALPKNYTWRIPAYLQQSVKAGSRVEVQLKNKKYSGIIKTLHSDKPAAFEPKEILNVKLIMQIYPIKIEQIFISDFYQMILSV